VRERKLDIEGEIERERLEGKEFERERIMSNSFIIPILSA